MNSFVYLSFRKKILKSQRLRNCMILIALVCIPLFIAIIFSESMMSGITDKYICLSDGHIQSTESVDNLNYIYSCDKVTNLYAIVYSASSTSKVRIKGVEDSYFNEKRLAQISFSEKKESNLKSVSISKATAATLGVKTGDKIAMLLIPNNSAFIAKPVLVNVGSIFTTGYDMLDKNIAFSDYDFISTLFKSAPVYEILLNNSQKQDAQEVANLLNLKEYSLWSDYNSSLYSNFVTSRQMIILILCVVICVASYYTAMVSNMIISEDYREFAIQRLLGCSLINIKQVAFMSVTLVCGLGIVIGCMLSLIISHAIGPFLKFLSASGFEMFSYYLLDFDIIVPFKSIILLCIMLLTLSSLCILLTLRKMKNISPIQLFTEL